MPGGSKYPGPAEALERYRVLVDLHGQTEVKGARNPYTSRNGHMFSFLDPDGTMALRLPDDRGADFQEQQNSGPVMQYGKTMRGYVSVPDALLDDPDNLGPWFAEAWEWIGTLPPK